MRPDRDVARRRCGTAGTPADASRRVLGRRGRYRRHAHGARAGPRHVARARAAVARSHRPLRRAASTPPSPSTRGRSTRPPRSTRERRAGTVRGPLHGIPIALKDNIQTTEHAHDRRRPRVRAADAALRGHAHDAAARRGSRHHRQDGADGARQLGGERHADQLQLAGRVRVQSLRSAAGSAAGLRRPAAAADGRIELGHRHGRQLLGRQRRHRDVGVDPQPGQPHDARGHQADGGTREPLRRHPDHGRSGHARADGPQRRGCGHAARRARRRRARSARRRHASLHPATARRLHRVPAGGRAERRAHRRAARLLLPGPYRHRAAGHDRRDGAR